jgi:hypothetical protein
MGRAQARAGHARIGLSHKSFYTLDFRVSARQSIQCVQMTRMRPILLCYKQLESVGRIIGAMGNSEGFSWQVSGFGLRCSGNAIECRQIAPIREVVAIPTRRASEGAVGPIPGRVNKAALRPPRPNHCPSLAHRTGGSRSGVIVYSPRRGSHKSAPGIARGPLQRIRPCP